MLIEKINQSITEFNEAQEALKIAQENIDVCIKFEQDQIALESVIPWDNFLVRSVRAVNRMVRYSTSKVAFDLSLLAKVIPSEVKPGEAKTKLSRKDIELYLNKIVMFELSKEEVDEAKKLIEDLAETSMAKHTAFGKVMNYMNMLTAGLGMFVVLFSVISIIGTYVTSSIADSMIVKDKETIDLIKRALKLLAKIINKAIGVSGDKFTEKTIEDLKTQANTLPKGGTNVLTEDDKKAILDKLTTVKTHHSKLLDSVAKISNPYGVMKLDKVSKAMLKHNGQVDEYNVEQLELLVRVMPEFFNYMEKFAEFSKQVVNDIRKI